MISWLYISSINNIIFVLYDINNINIQKKIGSLHNLVYSKMIEIFFLFFILVIILARDENNNYNKESITYGAIHGIINTIQEINYYYQRETKRFNIEKLNYITISCVELILFNQKFNPNILFSSYLISLGSILIDISNVNIWYKNRNYFIKKSLISNEDLEAPLLGSNKYDEFCDDFDRKENIDKMFLVHILSINIVDMIVKIKILKENIFTNILIFYINSNITTVIISSIYLKKKIGQDIFYNIDIGSKKKFIFNYALITIINLLHTYLYYYLIIIAPSISYVKAMSKSWGLILLEYINCHNNITKFNDLNCMGTLVIIYSVSIIYLTSYYQN